MKNTLLNMILVLGGISTIASAGVGYVYRITEEPIAAAVEANKTAALGDVLPDFDAIVPLESTLDGIPVTVHTATAGGSVVGYAVETATTMGFSGEFRLMVGFAPDGKVLAVKVLQHAETPGLGSKMVDAGNPLIASFEGRNPSDMRMAVRKDGGEVDALTAATITSRAYVDAIARAFAAMLEARGSALNSPFGEALGGGENVVLEAREGASENLTNDAKQTDNE
ncbi:MAG: RnfABCDGE type electron transport complex subunit G [Alistipes sp.]|jgi:electron transport complex protein RnfG|nr:RnfABCDGE type electron transport complex subunit G [Alistipes sp.]